MKKALFGVVAGVALACTSSTAPGDEPGLIQGTIVSLVRHDTFPGVPPEGGAVSEFTVHDRNATRCNPFWLSLPGSVLSNGDGSPVPLSQLREGSHLIIQPGAVLQSCPPIINAARAVVVP